MEYDIKEGRSINGLHTRTSDLYWLSVLSIGSEGRLVIFSRQRRPAGPSAESICVCVLFRASDAADARLANSNLQTRCSVCNREDNNNTSGDLRRRAILDLQGLPFVCCFLSSFFSFLRLTVSFSQKRGFPLKSGGSPAILDVKTWKYFLQYGCGVRFAFCCYLL